MKTHIVKRKNDKRTYLITPNYAAGQKNRYTVYRIPTSEGGRVKIIGHELDLRFAKEIASGKFKYKKA